MKKTFLLSSDTTPAQNSAGRGFFAVTLNGAVFCFHPTSFWVRR
jgi:hypothetical protein